MKKCYFSLLFLLLAKFAGAHPHSFLDMKTNILIENNAVKGFEMAWTLDEIASSELIYELKASSDKAETEKSINNDLTQTAIENHYFSYLYDDKNQPVKFLSKPENAHFSVKDNRITYFLRVLLAHPHPANRALSLYTYEPSYYLSMTYTDKQDLTITDPHCQLTLAEPNVNNQLKKYARALDKNQAPDMPSDEAKSLGAQFAQKVSFVCN